MIGASNTYRPTTARFEGASSGAGFSMMDAIRFTGPEFPPDIHDPVAPGILAWNLLDRYHPRRALRVKDVDEVREAPGDHQIIGEYHRERRVPHRFARAPHGVPEPERPSLGREGETHPRRDERTRRIEPLTARTRLDLARKLFRRSEVGLEHRTGAVGHEDELRDAGRDRFLHRVLDERPVDDRQHLLRHRAGHGQHAGPETGDREDTAVLTSFVTGRPSFIGSLPQTAARGTVRLRRAEPCDPRHQRPTPQYRNPSARMASGS